MNFVGDKLNDLGPNRFNRMEICRHLRADLKSQFPKPWKFTVKKEHYQGITITIKAAPKSAIQNITDSRSLGHLYPEHFGQEIYDKLMKLGNAYNYDNSEIMTDYFDVNYYLHWDLSKLEVVE